MWWRKQWWVVLALLLAAAITDASLLAMHKGKQKLLPQADRLKGDFSRFLSFYNWVSDREVITRYREGERGLCLVDTTTGAETPLNAFNKRWQITLPIGDQRFGSYTGRFVGSLSPDGKRFYWQDRSNVDALGGGKDTRYVALLNGEGSRRRLPTNDVYDDVPWFPNGWTPDGRGWVDIPRVGDTLVARIYSFNTDAAPRDVSIPISVVPGSNDGRGNPYRSVLGFTPKGRLIAGTEHEVDNNNHNRDAICLVEFGIEPGAVPPREYWIPIPPKSLFREADLSPQGDRLAWIQRVRVEEETSAFRLRFARWLPFLAQNPSGMREELWVTRLDGSQRHIIGYREYELSTTHGDPNTSLL